MNEEQFLNKLDEKGISFTITVPIPQGYQQVLLKKDQVLEYLADKYSVLAKCYGVSRSEYVTWLDQDMSVQCCATTVKGKRCKNVITGGLHVSVEQWVKSQGLLCDLHEEKVK